jgi:hypothetical protein
MKNEQTSSNSFFLIIISDVNWLSTRVKILAQHTQLLQNGIVPKFISSMHTIVFISHTMLLIVGK